MDEFQKLEALLSDLDFDAGRAAHTHRQALLLTAIAQVKATKENTIALQAIATSLAEIAKLIRQGQMS